MTSLVARNLLPLQASTLFFPSGTTLRKWDTPLGRCWPYQPQLEMEPAGPHISVATPIGTLCSSGTGNSKARQRSNSLPAAELTLVLGDLLRHVVSMKPHEITNHMTHPSIKATQCLLWHSVQVKNHWQLNPIDMQCLPLCVCWCHAWLSVKHPLLSRKKHLFPVALLANDCLWKAEKFSNTFLYCLPLHASCCTGQLISST